MKIINRLQFYYDKNENEVKTASILEEGTGKKPSKHPDRFIYIGAWQSHQNFPYIEDGKIKRKSYKTEILYDIKQELKK